jgi:hypothetical protein
MYCMLKCFSLFEITGSRLGGRGGQMTLIVDMDDRNSYSLTLLDPSREGSDDSFSHVSHLNAGCTAR